MPHPVEEGSGAPSFRPLWRLMPYLWPKSRPDLRARVVLSILFLMLGIIATTVSQQFLGAAVDAFITRGWLDEFLDRCWRFRAGAFA